MANPVIKIKRSAVAGKVPTTTSLELGELAINTYDGKLFIQQDQSAVGVASTVIAINPWSVGVGSIAYNTYFTAGSVGIGTTLPKAALNVVGVVSATSFVGDGSQLTGISAGGGSSQWISNSAGIHTLGNVGVGTTNPSAVVTSANTGVLAAGIVTAYKFYGDGSNITGISAVARVTVSQTAPSSPTAGDLWYHTTLARLFVYFNDGSSSQWVDAAPFNIEGSGAASVSVGATAPTGPSDGDLWYNSNYGRLFIYYKDGTSDQWVDAAPFNYPTIDTPTKTENSFIATAGQTTFNVIYDVGFVEVYSNGIRLTSTQYTATSGTSIVLATPASAGAVIDVVEIATGRGPTGAQGPAGETTLAGIGTTASATTHYPLFITGLGTTVPFISTTSNYFSFIPSSGTLSVNQLNVVGTITASSFSGVSYATSSGIATYATTAGVSTSVIGGVSSVTQLNVSGISTLGTVQISSGIITATSGVVTYYGDGSKLSNIISGVSISTDTTNQAQLIPYVVSTGSTTGFGVSASGLVFNPSTDNLGINTSTPTQTLHVQGSARITGGIYDSNNNVGTAGSVLSSTGTGLSWIPAASGGGSSAAALDLLEVMMFS
jgi:hypothetical protein